MKMLLQAWETVPTNSSTQQASVFSHGHRSDDTRSTANQVNHAKIKTGFRFAYCLLSRFALLRHNSFKVVFILPVHPA